MHGKQTFISPSATDRRARESRAASQGSRTFAFDKSYWSFDRDGDQYAGQEQLFEDLGKPLLQNAFLGYNAAIFAYGQVRACRQSTGPSSLTSSDIDMFTV